MESVPETSAHPGTCAPYACPSQSLSPATAVQSRDRDRTPCSVWFCSFDGKIKLPSEKPGTTAVMTLRTGVGPVLVSPWRLWTQRETHHSHRFYRLVPVVVLEHSCDPVCYTLFKAWGSLALGWGEAHIRFLAPVCEKPLAPGPWDIPG